MLKQNYYYVVAGLPDLFFDEDGQVPDSRELKNEIRSLVTADDFEQIELLYLAKTNEMLLNRYFETDKQPQTATSSTVLQPPYILEFREWAQNKDPQNMKLEFENKLYSLYYDYVLDRAQNDFLRKWFLFELNVKNILTAANCKHFHYSFSRNLIRTKLANPVYAQLRHKHLKPELFEDQVPMAKEIFELAKSHLEAEKREMEIDRLYWKYLDEQTNYDYFTIERILVHIIKLHILERWNELEKADGKAFLTRVINEIKLSYDFVGQ